MSTPIRRTSVRSSSTAGVSSTVSPSTTLLTVITRALSFRLRAPARGVSSSSVDPSGPHATSAKSGAKRIEQTTRKRGRCGSAVGSGDTG
jgi:hypothetical protein